MAVHNGFLVLLRVKLSLLISMENYIWPIRTKIFVLGSYFSSFITKVIDKYFNFHVIQSMNYFHSRRELNQCQICYSAATMQFDLSTMLADDLGLQGVMVIIDKSK